MNTLLQKILGVVLLFGFIYMMKFFDDYFTLWVIVCVALYGLLLFSSHKTLSRNLGAITKHKLITDGGKGLIFGFLLLFIPIYNVHEAYQFAYKGLNQTVTVNSVDERVCITRIRKSRSENPCWIVKFKVEDTSHERHFFSPTKKGDKFNVIYVPGKAKDIKYEDPIVNKLKYVTDAFGSFSMLILLISLYMISNAILKLLMSRRVKSTVPQVHPPTGAEILERYQQPQPQGKSSTPQSVDPDGRVEPKF